jgi:acetyl-CoA/propionyl-CoA carboxylase biotin carboxyl carrier protein
VPPFAGGPAAVDGAAERTTVVVEVGGKRLEVSLPATLLAGGPTGPASGNGPARRTAAKRGHAAAASGDAVASPMQGTIVKVAVADGDQVAAGDLIVVLEAMKMEQPLNAHKSGVVTGLTATPGALVNSGQVVCEIS